MKTGTFILILAVVLLVGLSIIGKFRTGNAVSPIAKDVFEGKITNINLAPQILDGTGVYDRTCQPAENGLTQCDAGIQTDKGLLNFNYNHDMHAQGCLDAGQKLKVEVLANNQARVTRL